MNSSRFDALTRRTAQRFTRRAAVTSTGVGLAAVALGAAGLGSRVGAQEASPVAEQAADVMLLYVQSAGATTLAPGDGGIHTLTMTDVTGQTLYFSDRPARIAGTMPTDDLVATWAKAFADSPPNAVLIGHLAEGEEAVVVELLDPVYDGAASTLTYQVQILQGDRIADRTFAQEPLTELDAPREYTEAHLFIDDIWECLLCEAGLAIGEADEFSAIVCSSVCD
jgi:hypothetical protein